jgi:hypothetical protein
MAAPDFNRFAIIKGTPVVITGGLGGITANIVPSAANLRGSVSGTDFFAGKPRGFMLPGR